MKEKILVAYFSAEGTTAAAARTIASELGADLFEIKPETPYTAADLNWMNKKSRSSVEMSDPDCRPEISENKDTSENDTILISFPIWWYVEPRIVDTYLSAHDLSGKTVIPFATSGGSGIERAEARLKALFPSAYWRKGIRLTAGRAAEWAKNIKASISKRSIG